MRFEFDKTSAIELAEVRYLRQIRNLLVLVAVTSVASMVMFIVLLAGGLKTSTIMTRMESQMSEMTEPVRGLKATGDQLKDKFPANQAELTIGQVLGMISDGKNITERIIELTKNVDDQTVRHMNTLIQAVDPAEVNSLVSYTQQTLTLANGLLASVDAKKINAVLTMFGNVKIEEINSLLKKISDLHELKIQL